MIKSISYFSRVFTHRFSFLSPSDGYERNETSLATTTVTIEQKSSYRLFIGVIFLLAIVGFFTNDMLILTLVFFFLLFLVVNRLYLVYAVKNIDWSLEFENQKVFPNEQNTLTICIENNGVFPILQGDSRVKIDAFENAIQVLENKEWVEPIHALEDSFQLWARARLKMNYDILSVKRGTANVSSVEIKIYDFFQLNFVKIYSHTHLRPQCLVYPKLEALANQSSVQPEGNATTPKPFSLNEDTLIRGSRPYQLGDSFNRINWKLTSKHNELQTKEFEKINNPKWTIVINLNEADQNLFIIEELETLLSQVAYTCKRATSQHVPYEMFINQKVSKSPLGMHLKEGSGNTHLSQAFERLSRLRRTTTTTPIEVPVQHLKVNQLRHPYVLHFGHVTSEVNKQYGMMERQGSMILKNLPLLGKANQ